MSAVFETRFQAWSCDFALELIEPHCNTDKMVAEIKSMLEVYELLFSRFQPESLLSQINKREKIKRTEIFDEVLEVAVDLTDKLSADYFNPHVNLDAHGYKESIETQNFSKPKKLESPLPIFPAGLNLDPEYIEVQEGVTIDFGAFLKGYLAQQIADKYKHCCRGILVNFGGDMCVRGKDVHNDKFTISIYNPVTRQDESIKIKNKSLTTSGNYKRIWKVGDQIDHHILNPKSHESAVSDYISISFAGADGALCDALCTAAFNATPEDWKVWQEKFGPLDYIAIKASGAVESSLPLNQ